MRSHERSSPNLEVRHGRRQQALVMPGRNDVTLGSGGEKFNAKPASESHAPTAHTANASNHSPESEQRQSKPGGQSAIVGAQRQATARQPRKQRNLLSRQGARPVRLAQCIGRVRCGASGWHKHTEQARMPGPSSHNVGRNASKSNAATATSSATHPVGKKRETSGCQNALANGAARHQVTGSSAPTHRKAPAANQTRNNVAGCRHPDAITRKQIEAPTPKIRRGITACA